MSIKKSIVIDFDSEATPIMKISSTASNPPQDINILLEAICCIANVLIEKGVTNKDRVADHARKRILDIIDDYEKEKMGSRFIKEEPN